MVKIKFFGIITVLFLMCNYIKCYDIDESPYSCVDLKPQNQVDIDQILGTWFGHEIITHRDDKNNELDRNACVTIDLADITDSVHRMYNPNQRPNYRYLKLIWNDGNNDYEHILLYNQTIRGIWISKTIPPSSANTTVMKQNFGQFTGVIQVIKVVGGHMVLTFCEKDGRLFSIALARSSNLITADDLGSAHALLMRRGLSIVSAQRLCAHNGSTIHNVSFMTMLIAIVAFVHAFF